MRGLILGSGMYVTGRGYDAPGTLLATLVECARRFPVASLTVAARSASAEADVRRCMEKLASLDVPPVAVDVVATGDAALADAIASLCADGSYDFAVLCLPDHLHFEGLSALLRQRVPTLVVKPLVTTSAEAEALLELQERYDTYAAVEFHKRWDESNLLARRMIRDGEIGDLAFIGVDYWQRIEIPTRAFRGWSHLTNIFQYLGVHYVDLIHFLTGATPKRLTAAGTRGILAAEGVDTWDSIHCTIEWTSRDEARSFASVLNIGWVDPDTSTAMSNQRIYFVGSRGRLDCDQKHRGVEWVPRGRSAQQLNPYFSQLLPYIGGPRYRGYALDSVAQFIEDVTDLRSGRRSRGELEASDRPTLRSAKASVDVAEAAAKSLANDNRWIPIDAHARP